MVEQLTTLIEGRHERLVVEEGERAALEMWQESERRHEAARRGENRAAWASYHQERAESPGKPRSRLVTADSGGSVPSASRTGSWLAAFLALTPIHPGGGLT
jgi:hypothetical protein